MEQIEDQEESRFTFKHNESINVTIGYYFHTRKNLNEFRSSVKSNFSKLTVISFLLIDKLQVAGLLVSVLSEESLKCIVAALKTVYGKKNYMRQCLLTCSRIIPFATPINGETMM